MYVEVKGPFTVGALRKALEKFSDGDGLVVEDISDEGTLLLEKCDDGNVSLSLLEYDDDDDDDDDDMEYKSDW